MKSLKAATLFIWDIRKKNVEKKNLKKILKKVRNIYCGNDSEYLQTYVLIKKSLLDIFATSCDKLTN